MPVPYCPKSFCYIEQKIGRYASCFLFPSHKTAFQSRYFFLGVNQFLPDILRPAEGETCAVPSHSSGSLRTPVMGPSPEGVAKFLNLLTVVKAV